VDWFDITGKYHTQTFGHGSTLSSLPEEWQREMAALWRLESDVNNGAYLQFLENWGRESYEYASEALKKIGARKMAKIIDRCQALVDEHFNSKGKSPDYRLKLAPNRVIDGSTGKTIKDEGSVLPDSVVARIMDLSYEFMDYPEDIEKLGLKYYKPFIDRGGK
jgi:hypothetical protein